LKSDGQEHDAGGGGADRVLHARGEDDQPAGRERVLAPVRGVVQLALDVLDRHGAARLVRRERGAGVEDEECDGGVAVPGEHLLPVAVGGVSGVGGLGPEFGRGGAEVDHGDRRGESLGRVLAETVYGHQRAP
jgi:hypothetical protein